MPHGTGTTELWSLASPDALQRTVDLARRFLPCDTALVSSFMTGARIVRAVAGNDADLPPTTACLGVLSAGETVASDLTSADPAAAAPTIGSYLGVPLRLANGQAIGTLCVTDRMPRVWSDDDRALVEALASHLLQPIDQGLKAGAQPIHRAPEPLRLTNVLDHGPALVFERRKTDAARSSFTFFGARKATLPGIRQLAEDGEAAALDFIESADRDLVRAALTKSVLEETDLELTFRVTNGTRPPRWLNCQMLMRRDEDGTIVWDGVALDITDLVTGPDDGRARIASLASDKAADPAPGMKTGPDRVDTPRGRPSGFTPSPSTPVFAASPRSEETPDGAPSPVRAGGRILLADDLDLNRRLIADMLAIEGHVVDCVADGAAAVAAARAASYDLVLMDMIMPGMDGIAATLAIRALPAPVGTVPIVALTANSYPEQLDSCIAAGMNATLTKPMSLDALMTAVQTWMRRSG